MSLVTLAEGAIFAGRYKIVRNIATGGMGAVYEVVHVETARRRALKVMHPHLVQSEDLRKRFLAEARIAGEIDSAYVVDVFDTGVDESTRMPFLVMELLKGEELGKRLKRVGKFGLEETVGYLWQTALALDKTHKANIVHRDLKPENLFLCEDEDGPGKIKVLDFGIAKLMLEGGTQANVTRALGTPLFMAPEQFKSKSTVSAATDIHALGMMAYSMLVGAPYWADEQTSEANPYAFAVLIMRGPPEPPTARALRKGVQLPAAFDDWFGQATSPNPEQRFFKATVAVKGLAQALGIDVPGAARNSNTGVSASQPPAGHTTPVGQTAFDSTKAGQTGPGKTNPGQTNYTATKAGQTGPQSAEQVRGTSTGPTAASSSGPQGTAVLDSTSPSAHLATNPSEYGLSASQPRVLSEPHITPVDAGDVARLARSKKRRFQTAVGIGVGTGIFLLAIGVVALSLLNRANSTPALSLPSAMPSATAVSAEASSVAASVMNAEVSASVNLPAPVAAPSAAASVSELDFDIETELDAGSDATVATVNSVGFANGNRALPPTGQTIGPVKPPSTGGFSGTKGYSAGKPRLKNVFEVGGRQ